MVACVVGAMELCCWNYVDGPTLGGDGACGIAVIMIYRAYCVYNIVACLACLSCLCYTLFVLLMLVYVQMFAFTCSKDVRIRVPLVQ